MKHRSSAWTFAAMLAFGFFLVSDLNAAQINFTPSVIGRGEYNDNIFLDSENEESDYITTAGLGLAGEILWREAGIRLNYEPSYVMYKDNDDLDYWRHSASGSAWYDFSQHTRISFRNTYLRTANPTDESDLIDRDAPIEGRDIEQDLDRRGVEKYYRNVASTRLSHQFGERNNAYLAYQYSILRNVNARTDSDREEHDIYTPSAGFSYWFTTQWGTEVSGSYSHRDLEIDEDRDVYDGTGRLLYRFTRHLDGFVAYRHTYVDFEDETSDSNYTVYNPTVGIFYQFEKNSYARIGLGYYIQDKDNSDNPNVDDSDENGFLIDSVIFKAWPFRRGNISLLTSSGYQQDDSGSEDNGFNIYYEGRVAADYALLRRLTTDAYLGYRIDDYPDQEPNRTDKTLQAGVGLSYQPLPWLTSRLGYTLRDRRTDDNDDEYTENRVFLTVTISPELPFRLLR